MTANVVIGHRKKQSHSVGGVGCNIVGRSVCGVRTMSSSSPSTILVRFLAAGVLVLLKRAPITAAQAIKSFESTMTEWAWLAGLKSPTGGPDYDYGSCSVSNLPCDSSPTLTPGGRVYAGAWQAIVSPNDTNHDGIDVDLFLFGGFGNDHGLNNDLWRYNDTRWIWVGGDKTSQLNNPSTATWPGDRCCTASWAPRSHSRSDAYDDKVHTLVFGGYGVPKGFVDSFAALDEVWLITTSRDTLGKTVATPVTSVSASTSSSTSTASSGTPAARAFTSTWSTPHTTGPDVETHWMFGGWNSSANFYSGPSYNDLWSFTYDPYAATGNNATTTIAWTQHTRNADGRTDWPSERHAPAVWTTPTDNGLTTYMFGGSRYEDPNAVSPIVPLNDLWRLESNYVVQPDGVCVSLCERVCARVCVYVCTCVPG